VRYIRRNRGDGSDYLSDQQKSVIPHRASRERSAAADHAGSGARIRQERLEEAMKSREWQGACQLLSEAGGGGQRGDGDVARGRMAGTAGTGIRRCAAALACWREPEEHCATCAQCPSGSRQQAQGRPHIVVFLSSSSSHSPSRNVPSPRWPPPPASDNSWHAPWPLPRFHRTPPASPARILAHFQHGQPQRSAPWMLDAG